MNLQEFSGGGHYVDVSVVRFGDRKSLQLQYSCPITGRKKTKSAGTSDRFEAEMKQASLERALNGHLRSYRKRNKCIVCGNEIPRKRRVCSDECFRVRRAQSVDIWRIRHPLRFRAQMKKCNALAVERRRQQRELELLISISAITNQKRSV